jgi:hypothetical protein
MGNFRNLSEGLNRGGRSTERTSRTAITWQSEESNVVKDILGRCSSNHHDAQAQYGMANLKQKECKALFSLSRLGRNYRDMYIRVRTTLVRTHGSSSARTKTKPFKRAVSISHISLVHNDKCLINLSNNIYG